jgi:hypothetical protein
VTVLLFFQAGKLGGEKFGLIATSGHLNEVPLV